MLETIFTAVRSCVRLTDVILKQVEGIADTAIARRIEELAGRTELNIEMIPSFEYASRPASLDIFGHEGVASTGGESIRLSCPARVDAWPDLAAAIGITGLFLASSWTILREAKGGAALNGRRPRAGARANRKQPRPILREG